MVAPLQKRRGQKSHVYGRVAVAFLVEREAVKRVESEPTHDIAKTNSRAAWAWFNHDNPSKWFGGELPACGADIRRFFGNANCDEAQTPTFR